MHHHHREDRLGANGYLSVHRGNQWVFATFPQCQSLEDTRHGGARRLWRRYITDAFKRRMHLCQEISHLLADALCIFDAGIQPSGLHRRLVGTQLSSNFKKIKSTISKEEYSGMLQFQQGINLPSNESMVAWRRC
jgi:hypothetical protein